MAIHIKFGDKVINESLRVDHDCITTLIDLSKELKTTLSDLLKGIA